MMVFEVVDRKEVSGSKVIKTRRVVTNKGTQGKPCVRSRRVAQEFKWMDAPTVSITHQLMDWNW